jgi:hypothetical protein
MSIVIDIAAQFTGKKAFNAAESAADKLAKNVKHALIGVGVTAFAKSAISAFAENEKQLNLFKNSLQSIGFEFATNDSLAFLNSLKLQYGVADSQLIPAYEQLLTTTRSLAASQNLTNVALDIAARQGISVTEAADALSKAYLGNTKAVGALGLGIDKATLASGDFAAILKQITNITKGAASTAANTFAGKLARLKVAADQAKESIGAGLVEALMQITKSQDIEQLQTKIINFGESAATALGKIGKLISDNIGLIKVFGALMLASFAITKVAAFITALQTLTKTINTLRNSALAAAVAEMFMLNPLAGAALAAAMVATIAGVIKSVDILTSKAEKAAETIKALGTNQLGAGGDQGGAAKYAEGAAARAAADAKAAAAAQLKATKAQTKAIQDQAKLKKSQGIMDVEQANIIAALQGKLTENEKIRLELQLALLTGNAKEADRLSNALLLSQAQTTELASWIMKLPKALNPFIDYPAYVLAALAEIDKMKKGITDLTAQPNSSAPNKYDAMFQNLTAQNIAMGIDPGAAAGLAASSARLAAEADAYFKANPNIDPMTGAVINVKVEVGGQQLTDIVTTQQINNSASGSQSRLNRLALMD